MSDSLKATVIVSVLVLTISANAVLELEDPVEPAEPLELDPPRLPAVEVPPPDPDEADPEEPEPELELELDDEPLPAEIWSPTDTLASEAIVPDAGARSLVSARVCWAFCRLDSALYTEASADAMLDGEGVVLVEVVPEVLEPAEEPAPPADRAPEDELPEPELPDRPPPGDGVVELGAVVVVVAVLVVGADPREGVVVVVGLVVVVVLGCVRASETNSVVPVSTVVLALVLDPVEPLDPADPVDDPSSTAVS
jgi:hypothetical protein